MAPATRYDARFYDRIRNGCRASAEATISAIRDRLPEVWSVVDVGCGEGWWAAQFPDGVRHGFDGGQTPDAQIPVTTCDLTQRIPTDDVYDLAICLEVAEHLPEASAGHLVAELVRLAPVVLFSAAMPRQGGTGHINCQPPAYWEALFASHGYGCDDELRFRIWNHPAVEPWYKSNLLLFSAAFEPYANGDVARHVIHPELWLGRR